MKKIILPILTFVLALATTNTFAQRNIDWSVDEIMMPPSGLQEKQDMSGSDINVTMVLKNLGPDSAKAGDSIIYRAQIVIGQGQAIFMPGQTANDFYLAVLDKDLAPDDTIVFIKTGSINLRPSSVSFNVSTSVISMIFNKGADNPIAEEEEATQVNNVLSEQIPWIVRQGWGVSVKEVEAENGFVVYPNPSNGIINLKSLIEGTEGNNIAVYDINGRVVFKTSINLISDSIDLSGLEKGIYFIEIDNGVSKQVAKISLVE